MNKLIGWISFLYWTVCNLMFFFYFTSFAELFARFESPIDFPFLLFLLFFSSSSSSVSVSDSDDVSSNDDVDDDDVDGDLFR